VIKGLTGFLLATIPYILKFSAGRGVSKRLKVLEKKKIVEG